MTVVNRTIETITITILIILLIIIIIIIPINFLFFVFFVLFPFSIQVHKYLHTIKYNDRYEGAVERVSHFSLFFASFVLRVFPEINDSSLSLSLFLVFTFTLHAVRTHIHTHTHAYTHTHTLSLSFRGQIIDAILAHLGFRVLFDLVKQSRPPSLHQFP